MFFALRLRRPETTLLPGERAAYQTRLGDIAGKDPQSRRLCASFLTAATPPALFADFRSQSEPSIVAAIGA
jgi:hypothetical protein